MDKMLVGITLNWGENTAPYIKIPALKSPMLVSTITTTTTDNNNWINVNESS